MILIDTSVWIQHLRQGNPALSQQLADGQGACHPFVVGELACGNLRNRSEILALLSSLPRVEAATHEEVLEFMDTYRLMGKGLGYVDVHLLASAALSRVAIWSLDKRLKETATILGLAFMG